MGKPTGPMPQTLLCSLPYLKLIEPVDKMSPAPKITSYDVIFEYFQRKNHKVPPKSKL